MNEKISRVLSGAIIFGTVLIVFIFGNGKNASKP